MIEDINVICLPFAGGNKYSYAGYQKRSPPGLNFITMEYAGHGTRMGEKLMASVEEISRDMYRQISFLIGRNQYALYGHSMGAAIGMELLHMLLENGRQPPLHFFVTGATAPTAISRRKRNWHQLPKTDFITKLKELKGCPDQFFEDPTLVDFLEPIIRTDFKAIETFQYKKRQPLDVPITVVTGTEETMLEEEIKLWQDETTHTVDFEKMEGSHFFIHDCSIQILELMVTKLKTPLKHLYNGKSHVP